MFNIANNGYNRYRCLWINERVDLTMCNFINYLFRQDFPKVYESHKYRGY